MWTGRGPASVCALGALGVRSKLVVGIVGAVRCSVGEEEESLALACAPAR